MQAARPQIARLPNLGARPEWDVLHAVGKGGAGHWPGQLIGCLNPQERADEQWAGAVFLAAELPKFRDLWLTGMQDFP